MAGAGEWSQPVLFHTGPSSPSTPLNVTATGKGLFLIPSDSQCVAALSQSNKLHDFSEKLLIPSPQICDTSQSWTDAYWLLNHL